MGRSQKKWLRIYWNNKIDPSTFNKVKIINVTIPAKIKQYIEKNFNDEISFFRKKYNFIINFYTDNNFIIPEYKIELLNKNKKIVKKIDHVKIEDINMQNNQKNLINKKNDPKKNIKTRKKFVKKS